jgi:tetratricopeptide (TPR) repeat protein
MDKTIKSNNNLEEVNYQKALLFYKNNEFDSASKLLLENVEMYTEDLKTYELLINIYRKLEDYQNLIKILDISIKRCKERRKEFRELRKIIILNKLMRDINSL